MPVIVLTSRTIYVATVDGRIFEVEKDHAWLEAVRGAATHCEPHDERSGEPGGR